MRLLPFICSTFFLKPFISSRWWRSGVANEATCTVDRQRAGCGHFAGGSPARDAVNEADGVGRAGRRRFSGEPLVSSAAFDATGFGGGGNYFGVSPRAGGPAPAGGPPPQT